MSFIIGAFAGAGLVSLAWAWLLGRSYKLFDEQAKLTDEAMCQARGNLDFADRMIVRYKELWKAHQELINNRTHGEGEEWKNL